MISNFLQPAPLAYRVGVRWSKVTIIGIGLLGGSIGLAVRKRRLARVVYGFVRRKAAAREGLRRGALSEAGLDLHDAVADADLVIFCTPISQMEALATQALPSLKRGAIVTDVGSVKNPVVRKLAAKIRRAGAQFVGSHPMAGSERGGVKAAQAELFTDAVCVVTPDRNASKAAVRKVESFWRSLGSRVMSMDASVHDKLVSRTSHLPHLLASALTVQVLDRRQDKRYAQLCATGFRDTTRVAGGSPEMWRDITLANRRNIVRDLAQFEKRLAALRHVIANGSEKQLEHFLAEARELRGTWQPDRVCDSQG